MLRSISGGNFAFAIEGAGGQTHHEEGERDDDEECRNCAKHRLIA